MTHCIAECFELVDMKSEEVEKTCTFNSATGRAEGDTCTEDFVTIDDDRIFACQHHSGVFDKNAELLFKVCDLVIVHGLLQWDKTKKELGDKINLLNHYSKRLERAAELKVKLWVQIGSPHDFDIPARDLSEVIADVNQRKKFVTFIADFLRRQNLDGIYINWRFPGCPDGKCDTALQKDRSNSISLYKELAAALLPDGKVVANVGHLVELENAKFLGPDYQQLITKYVNFTIFEAAGIMSVWKPALDFPRNIQRMESLWTAIFSTYGPGLKKKAILMRDLFFHEFILLDPTKNTPNSKYNQTASRNYLSIPQLCALFRKATFTKVQIKNQKYAYSNSSWVPYEDYEHAQAEVERLLKKFDLAGFYMEMLMYDDEDGVCGAGRMPYIRLYGEALKGGSCIVKPYL